MINTLDELLQKEALDREIGRKAFNTVAVFGKTDKLNNSDGSSHNTLRRTTRTMNKHGLKIKYVSSEHKRKDDSNLRGSDVLEIYTCFKGDLLYAHQADYGTAITNIEVYLFNPPNPRETPRDIWHWKNNWLENLDILDRKAQDYNKPIPTMEEVERLSHEFVQNIDVDL
ncbi:MAG: hypothetical protein ABIB43_00520 [archaeon]